MSLRMVLKSTDSASTHSDNKPYNFRVRLPRSLPLTGEWTVELTEFCNDSIGRLSDKEIFVYCSICEDTIIGECQGPLLRRIYLIDSKNQIFSRPYRIPLRINDLTDLHIYIKDKNGGDASFLTGDSTVTLVFRQQWKSCLGRLTFLVRLYGSNFNTPTEEKTLFQWFDAKRREVGGCLTNEGLIWFQSDLPRCPNQTFSKCHQW